MAATAEIVAKLTLDGKDFTRGATGAAKDLAKIGVALSAVQGALTAAAIASAENATEMSKGAAMAGTTVAEFSKLNFAASQAGVSTEELSKAFGKIRNPSEDASYAFKQLGISLKDSSGQAKDQQAIMKELADKYKNFNDPVTKARASMAIFGDEGLKLNAFLAKGSEYIDRMAKSADDFGQVVSSSAAKEASKFTEDLKTLGLGMTGIVNVVGESVIAFANQSGILKDGQEIVKAAIAGWRDLSDETKNLILTVASSAAAFGTLVVGLGAVAALIPTLVSGFTLLISPIGILVIAMGALIATMVLYKTEAMKVIEANDKWQNSINSEDQKIDNLAGAYRNLEGVKAGATISNGKVRQSAADLEEITKKYNVSLLDQEGRYRNIADIMKDINIERIKEAKVKLLELQTSLVTYSQNQTNTLGDMYQAIITNDITARAQRQTKELQELGSKIQTTVSLIKELESKPAYTPARTSTKDPKLERDEIPEIKYKDEILSSILEVKKVRALANGANAKEIKAIDDEIKAAERSQLSWLQTTLQYSKVIETIANKAKQVIAPISDLSNTIADGIRQSANEAARDMEVLIAKTQKSLEEEKKKAEEQAQAQIDAIAASYDSQIAAITQGEDAKTAIIDQAANERLLIANAEYEAARKAAEDAYSLKIEEEQARYEEDRQRLVDESIDKEESNAATALADEDFKNYLRSLEQQHLQQMADMASGFKDKQTTITKEQNDSKVKLDTDAKAKIKALNDAKNVDLKAAEEKTNADLAKLEVDQQKRMEALKRQQIEQQWKAEVDIYNQTKAIKIAETIATTAAAAAAAFAALAPIPFVGPVLGAAAAATIIATGAIRIGQINSSAPIKPAALFMREGGVVGGNVSHEMGGVSATLESNEAVIDKARTAKVENFVDSGLSGGGSSYNIYFQPGSIVTGDSIVDDKTIEMFSQKFAERIQRFGGK